MNEITGGLSVVCCDGAAMRISGDIVVNGQKMVSLNCSGCGKTWDPRGFVFPLSERWLASLERDP